jgi:NADH:ubiquinone oxidoreductase subunit 3 (subunit A)
VIELYIIVVLCFFISVLVMGISRVIVARTMRFDKMEGYECGFQPFKVEIGEFDVQFYIVALLFLIFDVELMLLFPWSVIAVTMSSVSYVTFVCFMLILIIGMMYEWVQGGLDVGS